MSLRVSRCLFMSFPEQKCVSFDFVTSSVDVQQAHALDLDPLRVTGKEPPGYMITPMLKCITPAGHTLQRGLW